MPFMMFTYDNLSLNLVITVPMVLISTIIATSRSLTAEDDNMSCYKQPNLAAHEWTFNWICQESVMLIGAYIYRRITIDRFIEYKKAQKQQDQLQRLFDN